MKKSAVLMGLTAVFAVSVVLTSMAQAAEGLRINGSMSAAHRVDVLAASFKKDNPGVTVVVTGSNSQKGFNDFLDGNADMVMMSRQPTEDERRVAKQKGMDLAEKQIGRDGIAVIIKPENPVEELTIEQLKGIYTGKIKNWKELGGRDEPTDFDRLSPEWSETAWFRTQVMNNEPYADSGDVRDRFQMLMAHFFESGPGSIVFMSYGPIEYVNKRFGKDRYKLVKIRTDATVPGVAPSAETAANGSYPLLRDLYLVWNAKDGSPTVGKFAAYCAAAGMPATKVAGARD